MTNYLITHGDTIGLCVAGCFLLICLVLAGASVAEEHVKYPALPWRWRGRR